MYEVPSWKQELRRRLEELRERTLAAARKPAKAAIGTRSSASARNAVKRRKPAGRR